MKILKTILSLLALLSSVIAAFGQETPPAPAAPKAATIPAISEKKLANGLTVAVVEKTAVPLVTIQLLVKAGANTEPVEKAGLADLTASMLTKGTKTKSATEIAEAIEFLGGSINSGAGWNNSFVAVTVTSDKVDEAMAILADVVLNPKFEDSELDLLKSQTNDGLTYNLKQPGFLASFVASKYTFHEHPAGGTPASIAGITSSDVKRFYAANYLIGRSVLVFAGNITPAAAASSSEKYFGKIQKSDMGIGNGPGKDIADIVNPSAVAGILVIDLPKSGQAAVVYAEKLEKIGRSGPDFYTASVANSIIGGGYSSRLNFEIRIKRGLSYGASSRFSWRNADSNFFASAQTKNESAAEVAELVLSEMKRMTTTETAADEMVPRRSVLTGGFGRNLETTAGLAGAIGDLYSFGVPNTELNAYVNKVNGVTAAKVKSFAASNLANGSIIIVGDYSVFKDDLAKRFPETKINVIKADDLDVSKDTLHK